MLSGGHLVAKVFLCVWEKAIKIENFLILRWGGGLPRVNEYDTDVNNESKINEIKQFDTDEEDEKEDCDHVSKIKRTDRSAKTGVVDWSKHAGKCKLLFFSKNYPIFSNITRDIFIELDITVWSELVITHYSHKAAG